MTPALIPPSAGARYHGDSEPTLLTSTLSLPPVASEICLCAARTESRLVTSSSMSYQHAQWRKVR